jgi:hypothetical protein
MSASEISSNEVAESVCTKSDESCYQHASFFEKINNIELIKFNKSDIFFEMIGKNIRLIGLWYDQKVIVKLVSVNEGIVCGVILKTKENIFFDINYVVFIRAHGQQRGWLKRSGDKGYDFSVRLATFSVSAI